MKITKIVKKFCQLHWVFAFTATIFGLIFVFIVPPLLGIDETSHFKRAYQVSTGGFISTQSGDQFGGNLPSNITSVNRKHYDLWTNSFPSTVTNFTSFPGSAAYSPIAYIAPATGIMIANIFNMNMGAIMLMGRIFCLLVYVLLIVLALYFVKDYKVKWLVFAVAVLPKVIFQASIISADGLTNALGILLFALFIKSLIKQRLSKIEFITLVAAVILLPLVKFNYGFLSMIILFIPNSIFSHYIKFKMPNWLIKWAILLIAGFLAIFWLYIVRDVGDAIGQLNRLPEQIDPIGQVKYIIHQPLAVLEAFMGTLIKNEFGYVNQMIGLLGWNYVQVPFVVIISSIMTIMIASFYAKDELEQHKKTILVGALLSLVSILAIFAIMYITFNPVGASYISGVQGRYFLPVLPFLIAAITVIVPLKIKASRQGIAIVVISSVLICLSIGAICYALGTY